jgi:hypothetical protein
MLPHTPRRPHSVIPPYMLEHIAAHADEPLRVRARQTLQQVRAVMAEPSRKTDAPGVRAMTALAPLHVPGVVQRAIYNAKHLAKLPGSLVRSEGQAPIGNRASDEAYTYLGATYDFFWEVFGRDSLDNQGLPLVASVHYEVDYQNAFWDGKQMVFGDGDGKIFNRFTIALDIVAHELSHGITESEAGLIYTEQSGALNESMSDVFGSLVKQHYLQQTADQGHQWQRAAFDVGARDGLRRPVAGPRPAAGEHGRLHQRATRQWRRAHQFGDSEPGLLPGRDGPGRVRLGDGGQGLVRHPARPAPVAHGEIRRFRQTDRGEWQGAPGPEGRRADQDRLENRGGALMEPLTVLQPDAVLELAREGGVAYLPALNGPRRILLAHFDAARRQQICQLINQALPYAKAEPEAGRGDQRYFRLELRAERTVILIIPESHVPEGLVELWKGSR